MEQTLSQPAGATLDAPAAHTGALAVGTRLREFEIRGTIGEGGFSIVYAAFDLRLGREVAIKEYIPASLAGRGPDASVRVRSEQHRESFEAGLAGFMNEARLLAQFKHPALVEVLQFWEENGTAYMVMPRYRGRTLRQELRERGGRCDERWLKLTLAPVLDVLELMHARSVFHRDVAPDNILVQEDGSAVLLDLGSAREILSDRENAVTVVVKPGYAPLEQYSGEFALPQGPWTDVYAFGALLHFAVTGSPPQASISRVMKDSCQPLAGSGRPGFSAEFLAGIDAALALQPAQRPQSARALREALGMDQVLAAAAVADAQAALENVHHDDAITAIVSAEEMADIVDQVARAIGKPLPSPAPQPQPQPQPQPTKPAAAAAPAALAATEVAPIATPQIAADPFAATASDAAEPARFADVEDLMEGRLLGATQDVRVVSESRLEARIDCAADPVAAETRPRSVLLLAALACGALAALAIGLWALLASGDDGLAPSTSTSKQQAEASTGQPADLQRTPAAEAPRSAESRRRALGLDLPTNQAAAADNTAPSTEPSPPQADTSLSVIAAEATQPLPTVEAPAPPVPLAQPLDIWAAPAPESADHELASAPVAASTQGAQNAAGDAPAATRASPPASSRTASKPVPVNVRLQVLPWGEVFVDGQRVGISPPLKQLSLSPGRHRIELRNGDFAPHVREIEVSAGTPIDVEHRFAPRP